MDNQAVIGGRKFSFGNIPPTRAIAVEVAIARVIGEPLFKAFVEHKAKGGAASDADAQTAGMAAIGMLMSKMDADELLTTMRTVFEFTNCDGQRIEMDATFVGRNKEVWQVFIAALKFNFSDFFPAGLLTSLQSHLPK